MKKLNKPNFHFYIHFDETLKYVSEEKNMTKNNVHVARNRNASIKTAKDDNGNLRTETIRRDLDAVTVAVSTNSRSEATNLFIDDPEGQLYSFDGRVARTIYRTLKKHYQSAKKSW